MSFGLLFVGRCLRTRVCSSANSVILTCCKTIMLVSSCYCGKLCSWLCWYALLASSSEVYASLSLSARALLPRLDARRRKDAKLACESPRRRWGDLKEGASAQNGWFNNSRALHRSYAQIAKQYVIKSIFDIGTTL